MKVVNVEQGSEQWLEFRRGKISGTRLGDIYSDRDPFTVTDIKRELHKAGIEFKKSAKKDDLKALLPTKVLHELEANAPRKVGFYETIAEIISVPEAGNETPMDRGLRLEGEAADRFEQETGKKLEIVGCWQSEHDERIINSPDRQVKPKKNGKITEAVEIKCLNSAHHVQAVIEEEIPSTYDSQIMQYFVVNEDLQTLFFVFYDPRIQAVPYYCIEIHRKDLGDDPEKYLRFQLSQLQQIDEIVERLTF